MKNTEPVAKAIKKGLMFRELASSLCAFVCVCVCLCVALSCQPLAHSEVLEVLQEQEGSLQAVQVVDQDTCRWGLRGGVGASWEACHREEAQQKEGQTSYVQALADLVPLVLSVLGGEGPMGGDPLGGSQGALQRRVGALHGVVEVLRGGEEVLRGVV